MLNKEIETINDNELDIDLSCVSSVNSIIAHICSKFEQIEKKYQRINLTLPDIDLSINQLESIKLIIESNDCILNRINTSSERTKEALDNIGIIVSNREDTKSALDDMYDEQDYEETAIKKLEGMLEESDSQYDVRSRQIVTRDDLEILNMQTKYVKQTLRSGQYLSFDGNVIIVGDCHAGSEIQAAGDITVWGKLLGICHAGKNGNKRARIRALNLNPIQIRIADLYTRKPDGVNINLKEKRNVICIEEAMVIDDEIKIIVMN